MNNSRTVVLDYLRAFYSADFQTARSLVADNFTFSGPFIHAEGKDAFFSSATGLTPIVRGFQLLHQWEDGEHVCTFYEFTLDTPAGKGTILAAEWNQVRDGWVVSARLVFDSAQFRRLVPAAPLTP